MTYLGPLGSWETNPFDPPVFIRATEPETVRTPLPVHNLLSAAHGDFVNTAPAPARPHTTRCPYCGKPVPVTRTTCENCGGSVDDDTPQAGQDTDALFRSIDVAELVQHPAMITVNRERSNMVCWHDLVMMVEYLELTDSGVWVISRTAMGELARATSATGERLISPVTSAPVQLFGYPLCWSAQSPHLGETGDVALVDWRVYHRLDSGWPDAPGLHENVYQISPFVILGEARQ